MIPLVAYERELELVRARVLTVAAEEGFAPGRDFGVGTMIELPRACLIADRIAGHADFFSFGTNDLTQTAIGFSRDDIEGRIIPRYVEEKIVDGSPFATIDEAGWASLCVPPCASAAGPARTSGLVSAGSTAATPTRSDSSTWSGWTTSAVPRPAPDRRVAAAQAAIAAPRTLASATRA